MAILFTYIIIMYGIYHNIIMIVIKILMITTGTRRFQAIIMWSRIVLTRHKPGELETLIIMIKIRMRLAGHKVPRTKYHR